MDLHGFRQELRRRCEQRGIDRDVADEVASLFYREGRAENYHLDPALTACVAVVEVRAADAVPTPEPLALALTPTQMSAGPTVEAAIRPSVEAVRRDLFGQPEAPWTLDRYPDAVGWLERVAEEDQGHREPPDSALLDRIGELAVEAGVRISIRFDGTSFRYVRPATDSTAVLSIARGERLYGLATLVDQVKQGTGIASVQVVAHVLCGMPFRLPRVGVSTHKHRVSLADGTILSRHVADVTLHTPDLTFEEMRTLYRHLTRTWGRSKQVPPDADPRKGRRRLTEKDVALLDAVERLGGVPEPGPWSRRGFWQEVAEELGYGGKQESLARRWRRLENEKRTTAPVAWQRPETESGGDDG